MIDDKYAAGFFDGEGCIHVDRNVRIIISGCFLPGLLDRFSDRWGGKVARASWSKDTCRPGVRWEITGGNSYRFLIDVLPHLIEKREQAELAVQYHVYKRFLNVRGGKGYTDEQRRKITELETQLRGLKRSVHRYL